MTAIVKKLNFQTGFDLTQAPSKQYNVALDLSEIAAGGELAGFLDAPTVDATHAGSAHHAQAHGPAQHTEGTAWRLVYQDANGDEQEIILGAAATVLTSNGASAAPSFQAAAGGVPTPWGLWVPDPLFTVGDAVWPSANRAIFLPFTVLTTVTVTRILIHVVVQSGNLDVGIYNSTATRLVSLGSTAVGAAGEQILNIADTELVAGRYYFAMAVDNTTARFPRCISYASVLGRWQVEASAFPLPASVAAFDSFQNYAPVAFLEISGGISAS